MKSAEARFWAKVDKTDRCWLWTASRHHATGYGDFWDGTKRSSGSNRIVRAHRFAYEMLVGPIPDGLEVDHTCHVRHCVNPDHLRLASRSQNMQNRAVFYGSSGVRGVRQDERKRHWEVRVTHRGLTHYRGGFATCAEAEAAAIAMRNQLFTHNDADRVA